MSASISASVSGSGGTAMAATEMGFLHNQLHERHHRLEAAIAASPQNAGLQRLLQEVDSALDRVGKGTYGLCEVCHDPVEHDRLLKDPLVCFCLDHLDADQKRALQEDLELAAQVQQKLLPEKGLGVEGWETSYHYEPLGAVSGDYCDLIRAGKDGSDLIFLLGDVSGKGVAASMVMTQLHALFRSLAHLPLSLDRMVDKANRVFCESALAGQYATLVCGRASASGEVELHNAGHPPAMMIRGREVHKLESSGMPMGMFCDGDFALQRFRLSPGESLVLFTDGLSEARDPVDREYGLDRVTRTLGSANGQDSQGLIRACLEDVRLHRSGAARTDDMTLLAIRRKA